MKIAASIPSLGCRDVPEQCSVVVRVEQVRTARDRGHQEQGQRGQDELAVDQGPSQEQEHNGGADRAEDGAQVRVDTVDTPSRSSRGATGPAPDGPAATRRG